MCQHKLPFPPPNVVGCGHHLFLRYGTFSTQQTLSWTNIICVTATITMKKWSVTHSILGLETGYCEGSWFSSVASGKYWGSASNLAMTISFHILSCSLLPNHPITKSYTVWTTDNTSKQIINKDSRIPLIQKLILYKSWYFSGWGTQSQVEKSSNKVSNSVCTVTVVASPNPLSATPLPSSATKT